MWIFSLSALIIVFGILIGLPCAVVGLTCGVVGYRRDRDQQMVWGLIFGFTGLISFLLALILLLFFRAH